MPGSIVQWSVVLVGFSVGRVGVQSLSELLVALIQMAGQYLVPVDESLTELGRCVPHFVLYSRLKICHTAASDVVFNLLKSDRPAY